MNRLFFDPLSIGFFDESVHGTKTILVRDPEWIRPTIQVPDPKWVKSELEPEAPLINVPDKTLEYPMIEKLNPDSMIPIEAVEITQDQYVLLLQALEEGKVIAVDENGQPIAVDYHLGLEELQRQVKGIASRKILDIAPHWMQNNMIARTIELDQKSRMLVELSLEEKSELNEISMVWEKVKSIRDYSNSLEAGLEDDLSVDINAGWPV